MLPDGSRLHVVIPQITRQHIAVNIRKFVLSRASLDDLVGLGTLTEHAARFLEASVVSGANVLVAGGTQAGKTTMLNALCSAIPARERVITAEEVFELPVPAFVRSSDGVSQGRRACIYVRISRDPSGQRLGVTRQLNDCRKRADELGWRVAELFEDNDIGAYGTKPRPAYQRMLAAIREGRVDAVVVWDLDRLTRRPIEIEEFIELADKHGTALASVGGDVDLFTDNGRLFARIKGAVARAEIERKSERQKAANAQRRAQGRPHGGGRRSFGYTADGSSVVDHEADALRRAAAALIAGESMRELARTLNRDGIPTTLGNEWAPTEVRRVLANPRNAGLLTHMDEIIGPGDWPAILDEDTYLAVRDELRSPARHKAGRPRQYLLSGVASCATCGARLFGAWERGRSYAIYRCESRKHVSRKADDLDALVDGLVVERLSRTDAAALFAKPGEADRAADLRREELALRGRLETLGVAFAEGDIDAPTMRAGAGRLREQLEKLTAELASSASVPDLAELISAADVGETWHALPMTRRREVVRLLMTVSVHPAGQGARTFRPETVGIEWRHR